MTQRKVMFQIYLEPWQFEAIKRLSATTRVPASAFLRDGMTEYLATRGEFEPKKEESAA